MYVAICCLPRSPIAAVLGLSYYYCCLAPSTLLMLNLICSSSISRSCSLRPYLLAKSTDTKRGSSFSLMTMFTDLPSPISTATFKSSRPGGRPPYRPEFLWSTPAPPWLLSVVRAPPPPGVKPSEGEKAWSLLRIPAVVSSSPSSSPSLGISPYPDNPPIASSSSSS